MCQVPELSLLQSLALVASGLRVVPRGGPFCIECCDATGEEGRDGAIQAKRQHEGGLHENASMRSVPLPQRPNRACQNVPNKCSDGVGENVAGAK